VGSPAGAATGPRGFAGGGGGGPARAEFCTDSREKSRVKSKVPPVLSMTGLASWSSKITAKCDAGSVCPSRWKPPGVSDILDAPRAFGSAAGGLSFGPFFATESSYRQFPCFVMQLDSEPGRQKSLEHDRELCLACAAGNGGDDVVALCLEPPGSRDLVLLHSIGYGEQPFERHEAVGDSPRIGGAWPAAAADQDSAVRRKLRALHRRRLEFELACRVLAEGGAARREAKRDS